VSNLNNKAILQHLISIKGSVRIDVEGSSMVPTIYPASKVIVTKNGGAVKNGDIVLFRCNGKNIVHRVYKKKTVGSTFYLVTKGDSMFTLDAPIPLGSVIGEVNGVFRKNKSRRINCRLAHIFWNIIAPMQLIIGKSKKLLPCRVQRALKYFLLKCFGCMIN